MGVDVDKFSRVLLQTMPDAVIYSDAEGIIQFWNHGAERMFGFLSSEALGQSLDLIIPENLRKRHWEGYDKTMSTGTSRYESGALLAVPAIRKDGTRISVEFTIVPFHEDGGKMAGIAAVMRDVTKQFEELRSLRKKVAQSLVPGNK